MSGYAAWVFISIVWGTTYLAIREALNGMPPMLLTGLRWVAAGLALGAVRRAFRWPARGEWTAVAVSGVLMMAVGNGGVVWAEQFVPSGIAAVFVATVPFWISGMDQALFRGRALTWRRSGGLACGLIAIVVLAWPSLTAPGAWTDGSLAGVAALQIACAGWALGSLMARDRLPNHSADIIVWQMISGGAVATLAGLLLGEATHVHAARGPLLAWAYLVIAGSAAGFTAYMHALRRLPSAFVSTYAYINPVVALAIGVWLGGEAFEPRAIVAVLLITIGVIASSR